MNKQMTVFVLDSTRPELYARSGTRGGRHTCSMQVHQVHSIQIVLKMDKTGGIEYSDVVVDLSQSELHGMAAGVAGPAAAHRHRIVPNNCSCPSGLSPREHTPRARRLHPLDISFYWSAAKWRPRTSSSRASIPSYLQTAFDVQATYLPIPSAPRLLTLISHAAPLSPLRVSTSCHSMNHHRA